MRSDTGTRNARQLSVEVLLVEGAVRGDKTIHSRLSDGVVLSPSDGADLRPPNITDH